MAKACDFCVRQNIYICNHEDHCGLCPLGNDDKDYQENIDYDNVPKSTNNHASS